MEYLKSNKQIEDEIARDRKIINTLFGEIEYNETCLDFKDVCPICKTRNAYRDWWCCKDCSKMPIKEFNNYLVKIFA